MAITGDMVRKLSADLYGWSPRKALADIKPALEIAGAAETPRRPLTVAVDAHGRSLYSRSAKAAHGDLPAILAGLAARRG